MKRNATQNDRQESFGTTLATPNVPWESCGTPLATPNSLTPPLTSPFLSRSPLPFPTALTLSPPRTGLACQPFFLYDWTCDQYQSYFTITTGSTSTIDMRIRVWEISDFCFAGTLFRVFYFSLPLSLKKCF